MASTERIFFAGVATSALLIGVGFGSGVMLGRTALEPVPQMNRAQTNIADKSPTSARVVLPALTEAALSPPEPAPLPPIEEAVPTASEPQAKPQTELPPISAAAVDVQKHDIEKDKGRRGEAEKQQGERAERRRKAAERERHRRFAESKARQETAREQHHKQQPEVREQAGPLGTLAFGEDDELPRQSSFFGN